MSSHPARRCERCGNPIQKWAHGTLPCAAPGCDPKSGGVGLAMPFMEETVPRDAGLQAHLAHRPRLHTARFIACSFVYGPKDVEWQWIPAGDPDSY